jgi:hypothetical protein
MPETPLPFVFAKMYSGLPEELLQVTIKTAVFLTSRERELLAVIYPSVTINY